MRRAREDLDNVPISAAAPTPKGEHADSFHATLDEEVELRKAGVVSDYILAEDKFPPNNRTLENFFRGAWTYHIHNQVSLLFPCARRPCVGSALLAAPSTLPHPRIQPKLSPSTNQSTANG
jgi:hypothetical protein